MSAKGDTGAGKVGADWLVDCPDVTSLDDLAGHHEALRAVIEDDGNSRAGAALVIDTGSEGAGPDGARPCCADLASAGLVTARSGRGSSNLLSCPDHVRFHVGGVCASEDG